MANGKYVAYYRVSTKAQGNSGLGLEAQREAVHRYLNGGSWTLLSEHTEIESGKTDARPVLIEAMQQCKLTGATLVIARLDRLSRNVAFLAALMDSGVEFVAVDNPHATRFTLHILGAVAEHERTMIAQRTKAALAAARDRGVNLGGYRGGPKIDPAVGRKARTAVSNAFAQELGPVFADMRSRGLSLRAMAAELNAKSILSARGGHWSAVTVRDVLRRLDA